VGDPTAFPYRRVAAKCLTLFVAKKQRGGALAATSILYHTQGLVGYRHCSTEYREGKIVYCIERAPGKRQCSACGASHLHLKLDGRFERAFLGLPVGRKRQEIVLRGHLQVCTKCGARTREPIPFSKGKTRYTRAFARLVVDLCGITTIKYVAQYLGVGWDLVKDIFKADLGKRLKRRKLGRIRYIAVDEFATHKGHKYMTVVIDLETGEVLHAQEGKDAAALVAFLEKLKHRKAPLEAIAMDMSEAYASAVRKVFGDKLDIVHDPFHVTALASKAMDDSRRDLYRQLKGEEKKVIKGTRFLLLKGLENLKEPAMDRLMTLMETNEPLYAAYMLKEDLRMFWSLPDAEAGKAFLDDWIKVARALGNPHFAKLANTLDSHRGGLLSYFKHRISTGPLEGLNNKIKVLKRQAYGFRDMAFFKLRLYFLHETSVLMPG
jgi:transposase